MSIFSLLLIHLCDKTRHKDVFYLQQLLSICTQWRYPSKLEKNFSSAVIITVLRLSDVDELFLISFGLVCTPTYLAIVKHGAIPITYYSTRQTIFSQLLQLSLKYRFRQCYSLNLGLEVALYRYLSLDQGVDQVEHFSSKTPQFQQIIKVNQWYPSNSDRTHEQLHDLH